MAYNVNTSRGSKFSSPSDNDPGTSPASAQVYQGTSCGVSGPREVQLVRHASVFVPACCWSLRAKIVTPTTVISDNPSRRSPQPPDVRPRSDDGGNDETKASAPCTETAENEGSIGSKSLLETASNR